MATTITIPLNDRTQEALSRLSDESGKSLDEIASEAIQRFVAVREFNSLRMKITPYARKAGLETEEDVIREVS